MEEQNKYYTPDISELHVGYECEHTSNMSAFICEDYDDVVKDKLTSTDLRCYITWGEEEEGLEKFVRTKYLDKEDIESCGWKWLGTIYGENMTSKTSMYELSTGTEIKDTKENRWQMKYSYDNQKASISQGTNWMRFFGECKSINELKKIMQWLNIK